MIPELVALKAEGLPDCLVDLSANPQSAGFSQLEAMIVKQSGKLKLPTNPWLKLDVLPGMFIDGGQPVSSQVVAFLIAKQSKHKEIAAAPDILPLLGHIDRATSAPFAAALVEGFLNSEQAASDRWALTLGGLLGDNRVIPLLLPRIQGWCENSRRKLAEYAAQAISLLPGNEPLMVLDTLSNRYRSKFKNEVKTLTKLLRETIKGQTARLEMTLVRQRRWPVARWRELYENHPLLRSFAGSLVWGVYDASGKLLRTFRRYPNGLLANAEGALEELDESDTVIGMVPRWI